MTEYAQKDHAVPEWRRKRPGRSPTDFSSFVGYSKRAQGRGRHQKKVSFGIILVSINPKTSRPEAVLVRGRYTDEYAEFVLGRYSRKNTQLIAELIAGMTVNERADVYSLDFRQMWYRLWLTHPKTTFYHQKLAKFVGDWMGRDQGRSLRNIIDSSRFDSAACRYPGNNIRYEFPKGRRRREYGEHREHPEYRETDLDCAIREFHEEAGIPKKDYQLVPEFKRKVQFTHMGVTYVSVYYLAVALRQLTLSLDMRGLKQVAEVSEVRWMDIEQIRHVDGADRRLENTVTPAFAYAKKFLRREAHSLVTLARESPPVRG